jgi:outer membrane receptor for ferrienterochelin and colicins
LNWLRSKQHWIGGITLTLSRVESNLFGDQGARGAAVFIQDEINWSKKFSSTFGLRFDYFDLDSIGVNNQLNPKVGIVYKIWPGAALRTSLGSSYRAPSIAEVFTSMSAGGLKVIPNLNLDPEKSWSYELGLNQILGQNLFFDLAFFYTRVWDLIEGKFVESGDVQFINITNARIMGGEIILNWEIIKDKLNWRLGYTYSDPWNLDQEKYLTYRPRHLFYQHAAWSYRSFRLDMDYRFMSRYDEIDDSFSLIIADAEERVSAHVVDLRFTVDFKVKQVNLETSLQINNILQYNYVDLVGSIAPIRHVVFTIAATF